MGEQQRSISVVVTYAIDAGSEARDFARRISVHRVRSRWFEMVNPLRLARWALSDAASSPPAAVVHGAARALDEFAAELLNVQERVADARLEPIALGARSWGDRVWRDNDEAPIVVGEVTAALDLLNDYRMNLARRRPLFGVE